MIERKFSVKSFDVFPNSTIKPSALQHYMQQYAREDCDEFGATYYKMREVNMVFVITKMAIEVKKPVFAYDELTVVTYNNSIKGITFDREYEFYRDGEEVIHASTQWVIVNYDSRKIVRPRDFPFEIESYNKENVELDIPRMFDKSSVSAHSERAVRLSDLDENDHLNNCVYSDISLDILPFDRKNDYVKEIRIIFCQEARINEILSLSSCEKDGRYTVYAYNKTGEKPCFEADCIFGKL